MTLCKLPPEELCQNAQDRSDKWRKKRLSATKKIKIYTLHN